MFKKEGDASEFPPLKVSVRVPHDVHVTLVSDQDIKLVNLRIVLDDDRLPIDWFWKENLRAVQYLVENLMWAELFSLGDVKRHTKKKILEQVNLDYPILMEGNVGSEKLEFFGTENPVETDLLMPISIQDLTPDVQAHNLPTFDLHTDDVDQPWPPPLALLSQEHFCSGLLLTMLTSLSMNHLVIPSSYLPTAYLLYMTLHLPMLPRDLKTSSISNFKKILDLL